MSFDPAAANPMWNEDFLVQVHENDADERFCFGGSACIEPVVLLQEIQGERGETDRKLRRGL